MAWQRARATRDRSHREFGATVAPGGRAPRDAGAPQAWHDEPATRRLVDAGPKDVHLYRGAADYAAADRAATGGRFARNLAFSLEAGPVAHVALQPEMDDSVFARTGLSAATRRTLAHEAVHLALHESMPNHEDQPAWMQEGLATWIADRVLVGAGLAPPPETAPLSATRTVRVQRLLERGALPTPRAILFTDLGDLTFNERYATWWLFWRLLAENGGGERMKSAIRAAWPLGGGTNYGARLARDIEEAWGSEALDALAWRTAAVGRRKYTIAGTLEDIDLTGPWGVGVQSAAAGIWRDVKLR